MTENQPPDSASPKKPQPMDYLPLGIIVAAAVLAILGKLTEEGIGPLMLAAMVLLVVFVVSIGNDPRSLKLSRGRATIQFVVRIRYRTGMWNCLGVRTSQEAAKVLLDL